MGLFDKLSLGTVYLIRRQRSREDIARDLGLIAAHGLKTVTLWPVVSWWDTRERPGLSFDTTLFALDACQKHGLKVIAELIGQNPALEMVPDYRLKPDHLIDITAGRLHHWIGWRNWSNPLNYNHPEVKAIITETMTACTEALKDHPALAAWDVFNETNFLSYDPITLDLYRDWLRRKYGTIAGLNDAWERTHRDFAEIIFTPATEGYYEWGSLVPSLDEDEFRCWNLASLVKEWADLLRRLDPDHKTIVDNDYSSAIWSFRGKGTDDWEMARSADVFGLTAYPFGGFEQIGKGPLLSYEDLYVEGAMLAGTRSAAGDRPFVVSELQTHHGRFGHPHSGVSPEALSLISWQALAYGARSVTYWKWRPFIRGEQIGSRGLTAYDGAPVGRAAATRRVAAAIDRNPLTLGTMRRPTARAAILVDPAAFVYGPKMGGPDPDADVYASDEILGFFRLLTAEGIEVEFLHGRFLDGVDLARFPLIVLPCQFVMDPENAARLRAFVEGGGTLVSSSRLAVMDRANVLYEQIPGGLLDVVGCRELDMAAAGDAVRLQQAGELPGGARFRQAIEVLDDAEIVDCFADCADPVPGISVAGMPAIVRNRFGKGDAWHFAFDFGYGAHHASEGGAFEACRALFGRMVPQTCSDPLRILGRTGPCEVHYLPCADGAVIIALNHTTAVNHIEVERGTSIGDAKPMMIDLDNGSAVSFDSDEGLIRFQVPSLGTGAAHVQQPDGGS